MNPLTSATRFLTLHRNCRLTTVARGNRRRTPISRTTRKLTSRSEGSLYSFISLKDLPDATFPGILRELLDLDFPMVVNTEVCIPDQAERLKPVQGQAAPHDRPPNGTQKAASRVNVDARVAEGQLMQTPCRI